jgi:hypothetical protein
MVFLEHYIISYDAFEASKTSFVVSSKKSTSFTRAHSLHGVCHTI